MAVEVDITDHISDLLSSGDSRSMKTLMKEDKFEQVLEEKASELIPIASFYLNKETMQAKPGVFRCAEKLLKSCAEKGNPKECLMEFLAQVESLDEVKFQILLLPIQVAMLRVPERKAPLMQCFFNVIYTFINSLPLPQDYHLDENSKSLLECDDNARRIRTNYDLIVQFYEVFVNEVCDKVNCDKRVKNIRSLLIQALFQLLGNPIVALDLEYTTHAPGAFLVLALKIVALILKIQSDPFNFLTIVEEKEFVSVEEESAIVREVSSNEFKLSDLSLSVFFYLVFCEHTDNSFPRVYDKFFLYQNGLTLAAVLLRHKVTLILRKGLLLAKSMIESVNTGSVHFSYLAHNVHKELIELLSNVAVYHDVEGNRKLAAGLIKQYFLTFEPKAQFQILLKSGTVVPHPNVIGYFTSILTSMVHESFSSIELADYFTGKRLFDLLDVYCSLKEGGQTDLIENKDQILSALNLIILLTRRDKSNSTGVWSYISNLKNNFLKPLRDAIDLSKAHFKEELKALEEPAKMIKEREEVSVSVEGQELSKMSSEEKKNVINSSLTVFDLIEHLLSRVSDCLENKPPLLK